MNRLFLSFSIVLSAFLFHSCSPEQEKSKDTNTREMAVIAYYYGDSIGFKPYATEGLTHIIYSFLHLKGNRLAFDKPEDSVAVLELVKLKQKNPSLKVLVSLGGWGGCETCSEVFSSEKACTQFALSVKDILINTKADGIDLDWEYPAIESVPGHRFVPEDRQYFTQLVQILRSTLGKDYEISFAAGGFTEYLKTSIDWQAVMPLVDRVNLMSYDLTNGNSVVSGHHTPLYSTPQHIESTDHGVRFLDSVGVPLNKIIIGAAFYARIFSVADSSNKGLYQPCKFRTSINYKDFDDSLSVQQGFVQYWDDVAQAPYAYNSVKKEFVTFDNERSMEAKVHYVKEKKLGGIMFWELKGDKTQNGLLETIYKTRNN